MELLASATRLMLVVAVAVSFLVCAALHHLGWSKLCFAVATLACVAAPLHLVLRGNGQPEKLDNSRSSSKKERERMGPAEGSTPGEIEPPANEAMGNGGTESIEYIECVDWIDPASRIIRGDDKKCLLLNNSFTEPEAKSFKVRSRNYLKKGVKVPSAGPALFAPIGIQSTMLDKGKDQVCHVAKEYPSLRDHIANHPEKEFLIVGWLLPGPPFRTVVFSFQRRLGPGADPKVEKLWQEFKDGTDEERKKRFKYLPRLDVAPKMVLSGVRMIGGEKPTLLCNKLTPKFFRGSNYMEIDIDISSSRVANMVTGMILPKLASVVVSHAFLIEGLSEEELPERVLAGVRSAGIQMQHTVQLNPDFLSQTQSSPI